MKKFLFLSACLLTSVSAMAQGTVNFANIAGGVNAPITNSVTGQRVTTADGASAELFYAAPGVTNFASYTALASSITPIGALSPGYFSQATAQAIPGFAGGSTVNIIVAAFVGGSYSTATLNGFSNPVGVLLVSAPSPSNNLVGLQSFSIAPAAIVPEPSTIVLGVLGGAALLLRRRKTA